MSLEIPVKSAAAQQWQAESRAALSAAEAAFAALQDGSLPATWEALVPAYNALRSDLDGLFNHAHLYQNVHPDADMRAVAAALELALANLVTRMQQSVPLYQALRALPMAKASAEQTFWHSKLLQSFERLGVDKDEATRAKVLALQDKMTELGQQFANAIRSDVRGITLTDAADLAGLPADYIAKHAANDKGEIFISTDYPDYYPFMTYAHSEVWRERLFRAARSRGYPQNAATLSALLRLRAEFAQLLGYASYADYISADKMSGSAARIAQFIDEVRAAAAPQVQAELQALQGELGTKGEVAEWQVAYLKERLRQRLLDFNSEQARQYFNFNRTLQGVFWAAEKLFKLQITQVKDSQLWHPSVSRYEIRRGQQLLGAFVLDLQPRQDKYKHAAMFPIHTGVLGKKLPEAALVCNFPAGPTALLSADDVETLFHEFGHLLHHILGGQQALVDTSGISTEWDFVEVPSQLFEEWAFAEETLAQYAFAADHTPMPKALAARLRQARRFLPALRVMQQSFYAALSLQFHQQPGHDLDALATDLQRRYAPYPPLAGTYFHLSFGHLEGYSALYYTYLWSEVIALELLDAFASKGLYDPEVAERYLKTILEPGGSQPANALVERFLGRSVTLAGFKKRLEQGGALPSPAP